MDFKAKILPKNGPLLYGNFIDPKIIENKPYVHMEDTAQLQKVVEEYLEDYNSMSSKPIHLFYLKMPLNMSAAYPALSISHMEMLCSLVWEGVAVRA